MTMMQYFTSNSRIILDISDFGEKTFDDFKFYSQENFFSSSKGFVYLKNYNAKRKVAYEASESWIFS